MQRVPIGMPKLLDQTMSPAARDTNPALVTGASAPSLPSTHSCASRSTPVTSEREALIGLACMHCPKLCAQIRNLGFDGRIPLCDLPLGRRFTQHHFDAAS